MSYHLFIAFLAPFFSALATYTESNLSTSVLKRQTTMIFYISLAGVLFLPLTLFFGRPSLPPLSSLPLYFIIACLDVVYLYPFYTALKIIDTSIVSALFSLGKITVPVFSFIFLGEILNLNQYIGFIVIVMASVALSVKTGKIPKLNRAFYYMVLASLITSLRVVLVKYLMNIDDNWVNQVLYPNIISAILPFTFLLVKKYRTDIVKNFPPYMEKFKIFVLDNFWCFLGEVCSIYGLAQISPVVSSAIGGLAPIFLLLLSYMALRLYGLRIKEKIDDRILQKKIFCFILIILGMILVV